MSTIRDVARLAGVSTATVSRVLNNDATYKMKDVTRDRVWKAVAQTGYRQRSATLVQNEHQKISGSRIGCILSVTREKYRDPFFMSIYAGIESRLAEKGYSVAFLKTYLELQEPEVLHNTFVDPPTGLILMEQLEPKIYRYIRARVPICVGIDTQHRDIDNVGYDHFEAGMRLTNHLIGKGHQKIAFIGGNIAQGKRHYSRRYVGFLAAMQLAELPVRPDWVLDCQWNELLCMDMVKEMMSCSEHPTAICAASDLMAMATLSALYSMGINVPGQVAVIGLSNIELSQFSSPPLTTFSVPTEDVGRLAADLLDERLHGYDVPPRRVHLPLTKVIRASV